MEIVLRSRGKEEEQIWDFITQVIMNGQSGREPDPAEKSGKVHLAHQRTLG